jgi:hypothetical protein
MTRFVEVLIAATASPFSTPTSTPVSVAGASIARKYFIDGRLIARCR